MSYKIDFSVASAPQIEAALCKRVEQIRLARNITQKEMAAEAGVSVKTIGRLERGEGTSLDTFIRVLTALGIQDRLGALLPDPSIRPMERVNLSGNQRVRARSSSNQSKSGGWTWGDEEENHG